MVVRPSNAMTVQAIEVFEWSIALPTVWMVSPVGSAVVEEIVALLKVAIAR